MCTKENKTIQMSLFYSQINHFWCFTLVYAGFEVVSVCSFGTSGFSFSAACLPCLGLTGSEGFPGRKYVVWSSQVLSSLSMTQKLPDEWESNHSSPWQNCLNCIQAWNWWGTEEAPVTCNLSHKHVRISSAKTDVLQPPAVKPCLRPAHSPGAL